MHQNSLAAFDEIEEERSDRANAIYGLLIAGGTAMTDRQVMHALGFHDMNAVRPRITELKESRWVQEVGTVECPVTGRHVRLVKALDPVARGLLIQAQRRAWQQQQSRQNPQLSLPLAIA